MLLLPFLADDFEIRADENEGKLTILIVAFGRKCTFSSYFDAQKGAVFVPFCSKTDKNHGKS